MSKFTAPSLTTEPAGKLTSASIEVDSLAWVESAFDRYGFRLALGAIFLLPLKLSLAYVFLLPLTLLWCARALRDRSKFFMGFTQMEAAYGLFLICVAVSALFGINPMHSYSKIGSHIFFALVILVYRSISSSTNYFRLLLALFFGQSLAAIHSVINGAYPWFTPKLFINRVTESGQIALTLTLAVGVVFWLLEELKHTPPKSFRPKLDLTVPTMAIIGALNLLTATLIGLSNQLRISGGLFAGLVAVCLLSLCVCFVAGIIRVKRAPNSESAWAFLLICVAIPLIAAAFLVNLKRGPWLGVTAGLTIMLFAFSRKSLIFLFIAIIGLIMIFEPLRLRLAQSSEHFFISGGRNVIWSVGADLIVKYPLGIGYENAPFLRKFAPEIPPGLEHFHNNIINIAVETGWLSFFLYLWWLVLLWQAAFASLQLGGKASFLGCSVGCALLAWQVAGLVEYNYGDSEVILIVYALLGILGAITMPHLISPPAAAHQTGARQ